MFRPRVRRRNTTDPHINEIQQFVPVLPSLEVPKTEFFKDRDVDTTLSWATSVGATSYQVTVERVLSTDPVVTELFVKDHEVGSRRSFNPSETGHSFFNFSSTYRWHVTAINELGEEIAGPTWEFTTGESPEFKRGDANADGTVALSDAL